MEGVGKSVIYTAVGILIIIIINSALGPSNSAVFMDKAVQEAVQVQRSNALATSSVMQRQVLQTAFNLYGEDYSRQYSAGLAAAEKMNYEEAAQYFADAAEDSHSMMVVQLQIEETFQEVN